MTVDFVCRFILESLQNLAPNSNRKSIRVGLELGWGRL